MEKAVYLGNDTAGYDLKMKCIEYLEGKKIPYVDCGAMNDPDIESTRYPFFAARVAVAVSKGDARCGVLVCGSGIGVSIIANKFKGVRAALCTSSYMSRMTRAHNDANILCLGGKMIGEWEALDILDIFLNTGYDEGFHKGSLDQITKAENTMMTGELWCEAPCKISTGPLKDAEIFDRSLG
ncbi:MAG: ribose 5-phosphate isomerase B [Oscillospiraceae bacterium]|nr:ribose 5-phosphate isomerase B [Oscillospiraceae bacterium]